MTMHSIQWRHLGSKWLRLWKRGHPCNMSKLTSYLEWNGRKSGAKNKAETAKDDRNWLEDINVIRTLHFHPQFVRWNRALCVPNEYWFRLKVVEISINYSTTVQLQWYVKKNGQSFQERLSSQLTLSIVVFALFPLFGGTAKCVDIPSIFDTWASYFIQWHT